MEQSQWQKKKVLIVVKTYPNKSQKYDETVCTAGVTEEGEWIRLYPIRFRYLDRFQQYKKFQWVTLDVRKTTSDYRADSYTPNLDTLETGELIETGKNGIGWARRRQILLPTSHSSMEEIMIRYKDRSISRSLGMFKPKEIQDLIFERIPQSEYVKEDVHMQLSMFNDTPQIKKNLEPIDTHFYYRFTCEDPLCKGHRFSIIDWEAGQLWRNLRQENDEDVARKKFKDKWLGQMCGDDRDTHFIVGNKFRTPSFMVLGVFYPPRVSQLSLF